MGGAQESGGPGARRRRAHAGQWGLPDGHAAVTSGVRKREVWGTARIDAPEVTTR